MQISLRHALNHLKKLLSILGVVIRARRRIIRLVFGELRSTTNSEDIYMETS